MKSDIKTTSGSNIRTILLSTGIDPRYQKKYRISSWCVYPPLDTWTVPLLTSLLEVKSECWEVNFDSEEINMSDDDIDFLIEAVATG